MSESRAPNCLAKEGRGISWRLDMGPPNFAGSSRSGGPIGQKSPLLLDSRSLPPAPLAGKSLIITLVCRSLAALRSGALRSGLSDAVNTVYALWYTICVP